jgi:hypothetical protein
MEACVGAHHLSCKLMALGHDARLMPARYVRPYSKGQKNDFRDAEAIAEAVQRPTMKFVVTKTADQLDLQALHRVRERLVRRSHLCQKSGHSAEFIQSPHWRVPAASVAGRGQGPLAVLRLMISSSFTACWIGKSEGFSPLRRRPV